MLFILAFIIAATLSVCRAEPPLDEMLARLTALEEKSRALTENNLALEQKTSSLEADNRALKVSNSALEADNVEIKAALGAPAPGELRLFAADACPSGWAEFNRTQGYLLAGRPDGGKAGTQLNRPLEAGEAGRVPPHAHDVTVSDPGHTHATQVKDPGHDHQLVEFGDAPGTTGGHGGEGGDAPRFPSTDPAFTGITVVNDASKSAIDVSISANDGGEHYPLVYVLICQKVLSSSTSTPTLPSATLSDKESEEW
jgi:hypothetical protein